MERTAVPYAQQRRGPRSGRTKNEGRWEAKFKFPSGSEYSGRGRFFIRSSYLHNTYTQPLNTLRERKQKPKTINTST